MKYLLAIIGLVVGSVVWLWLGGLAFCARSNSGFYWSAILPLGVCFIASALLGGFNRSHWFIIAITVALPSLFMDTGFYFSLVAEGRSGNLWIILSLVVLSICLIGARLGSGLTQKTQPGAAANDHPRLRAAGRG